jgi:hypothetical protein
MNRFSVIRTAFILILGISTAGCGDKGKDSAAPAATSAATDSAPTESMASRGTFGKDSCPTGDRVPVDSAAAYALYADRDGNILESASVENLAGTEGKTMCPTPALEDPDDPGACPPGYCARKIAGKTYCLAC